MTNEELSELEIKLLNVTKKFICELNKDIQGEKFRYGLSMEEEQGNDFSIAIKKLYTADLANSSFISLRYHGNAETEPMSVDSLYNPDSPEKFQARERYINFLRREIPQIRGRIGLTLLKTK